MSEYHKEPTGNDHHSRNIRERNKGARGNFASFPDYRESYLYSFVHRQRYDGFDPLPEWKKEYPEPVMSR